MHRPSSLLILLLAGFLRRRLRLTVELGVSAGTIGGFHGVQHRVPHAAHEERAEEILDRRERVTAINRERTGRYNSLGR